MNTTHGFKARSFVLIAALGNHRQIAVIGIIPEPESYALMLAGLALVGFMARSKQKIDCRNITALTQPCHT